VRVSPADSSASISMNRAQKGGDAPLRRRTSSHRTARRHRSPETTPQGAIRRTASAEPPANVDLRPGSERGPAT